MSTVDVSTPVVVLGTDHDRILGIARSLGRWDVPVYTVGTEQGAQDALMNYCRHSFVWNLDKMPVLSTVQFLISVARRVGQMPILIPTSDETAILVAQQAGVLRQYFMFPLLSETIVTQLCSKNEMSRLAKCSGVPVVQEQLLHDGEIRNLEATNSVLRKPVSDDNVHTWMFSGYCNEQSNCLLGHAGGKLGHDHAGAVHRSVESRLSNLAVEMAARRFTKEVGYRGIFNLTFRHDDRDGLYQLLDVNPHIGETFHCFPRQQGTDIIRALYLDMTGQIARPASSARSNDGFIKAKPLVRVQTSSVMAH